MDSVNKLIDPCVSALREYAPAGVLSDHAYWPMMLLCVGQRASAAVSDIRKTLNSRWTNGERIAHLSFADGNICEDWDTAAKQAFNELVRDGFPVYDTIVVPLVVSAEDLTMSQIEVIGEWIKTRQYGLQHRFVPVLFLFRAGKMISGACLKNFASIFSLGDLFQSGRGIPRSDDGKVIGNVLAAIGTDVGDTDDQRALEGRYFLSTEKIYLVSHSLIEKPIRQIAIHVLSAILRNVNENGDGIAVDQTALIGKICEDGALRSLKHFCDDVCRRADDDGRRHGGLARVLSMELGAVSNYINERSLKSETLGGWENLYQSYYRSRLTESEMDRLERDIRSTIKGILDPSEIVKLNTAEYGDFGNVLCNYVENKKDLRQDVSRGKWAEAACQFTGKYFLRETHRQFLERFNELIEDMAAKAGKVSRWLGNLKNDLSRESGIGMSPLAGHIEECYGPVADKSIAAINRQNGVMQQSVCGLDIDGGEEMWIAYIMSCFREIVREEIFRKSFEEELEARLGADFENTVKSALHVSDDDIRERYNQIVQMDYEVFFSGGNDKIKGQIQNGNVRILESGERNEVCLLKLFLVTPDNLRRAEEGADV